MKALMMPPLQDAKSYQSMYAYWNHIRIYGTEVDLATCDNRVAATFSQSCRTSAWNRNLRTANLECNRWIDEILRADYGILS